VCNDGGKFALTAKIFEKAGIPMNSDPMACSLHSCMLLSRSRTLLVLSLAVFYSLPVAAGAQAFSISSNSLNPAGIHVKDNRLTLQKEGNAKDPLVGDVHLDVKVTLHKQEATVADVLEALSKTTHVKLTVAGSEVIHSSLCLFADNTPLRDVLDGMAHLQDLEWVRRQDKSLELHPRPRRNQWDGVRPNTEAQAEQYRQGRQFLSQLSDCTPAMQNALKDMHQNGVTFGSLPSEMQKTVESMLIAATPSLTAHFPVNVPAPENSTIRLQQTSHQDWGNGYSVDVFDGHTYVGLNFPMFDDPNENTDEIVPASEIMRQTPWYGAAQDAASRQEIAKDNVRLKRLQVPVTLDLHDVPLAACLEALASKTGLSFAANTNKTWTTQKGWVTVHKSAAANGKPLMAVLDQLAALYGQTWGQTKSGMIVFHMAPERPAAGATARN